MRAVVIGKSGQLARCLAESVPMGVEMVCLGRNEVDIAAASSDFRAIESRQPEIVINAAAYTAVDDAEHDREAAFALNTHAPARLAAFTAAQKIPLIHVSTDYVFDGTASRPYTEDDAPTPLNVYGRSKLEGERAIVRIQPKHIIVRTSWLFSAHGSNFVKTMLRLAGERDCLRIVADQFGCPTSAHDLAKCIWSITGKIGAAPHDIPWGIYHCAGASATNWADFAQAIFASPQARLASVPQIERVSAENYVTPAARPRNSVLSCVKIGKHFNVHPRPWEAAITDTLDRMQAGAGA